MLKTSIIFLLPILLVFNIFGQKQTSKPSESKSQIKTTPTQIPKGWRLVNLNSFSFLLPESMKDQKAQGIDSAVWRFEDDKMILFIERGVYEVVVPDREDFENLTKSIEINGVKGKYFSINYLKPKSPQTEINEKDEQKPFLEEIVFKHKKYSYISFFVQYKNLEQQETAKQILYSIKFK